MEETKSEYLTAVVACEKEVPRPCGQFKVGYLYIVTDGYVVNDTGRVGKNRFKSIDDMNSTLWSKFEIF